MARPTAEAELLYRLLDMRGNSSELRMIVDFRRRESEDTRRRTVYLQNGYGLRGVQA